MKRYYSEYAGHCLVFYFHYPHPTFKTEADRLNWEAAERTLKNFTPEERQVLKKIFTGNRIGDEIIFLSSFLNITENELWELAKRAEQTLAKNRTLI